MLISATAVADRRLVPVDALCYRTVSWNDYAAGSTFTTVNVGGGVTMSLSLAVFSVGSDPLDDNHKVQTGPTGGIPGKALTFAQKPYRCWSEYHIHLLCSNLKLVIHHHRH